MTPRAEDIANGVLYLGLGVEDEKFLAPYYWFLPAICYLDYDHEQRLFLKSLKYETRQLTFWKEKDSITRMASIQHLKELRQQCLEKGLDSGLKATDLILIYFCDQNSDACERLFTERIADLLDIHVPGSQGTSLYIRSVFHLIEPFRKPDFGSPCDVQKSISCGITILRLWKKVIELQKLLLHSKRGAKNTPANRGHFVTRGCYLTAEILFAAATLHQLAMFLHFPSEAGAWASPYNSGTKTTERIISELQGKTTELQSLDSQPTFGDMLDRSAKVQFNLNAKRRIAAAGINVKSSSKRKRKAFAFKPCERPTESAGPHQVISYTAFRETQREAHRTGVRAGQDLFAKYMPQCCVDLLKENDSWDSPYKFNHPGGLQMCDGELPANYNKLDLDVTAGSLVEDITLELLNDQDEEDCNRITSDASLDLEQEDLEQQLEVNTKGEKWMISKMEQGKMTNIHISQAIKILLPREYIARCRQKRHWAAKFLPGKEPLNPEHDIVVFGNVAVKKIKEGVNTFLISRVERIESTKDGAEVLSFKLKDNPPVRLRCALYTRVTRGDAHDEYEVGEEIVLTPWRSPCGILGPVELLPIAESPGHYLLHEESKKWLTKSGYAPFDGNMDNQEEVTDKSSRDQELEEGFYEVEEVLGRRICKDMTYEFHVRFKGYGPEEDMWLPASSFNRAVSFQTTSRFGRKRKHKTSDDSSAQIIGPPRKKPPEPTTGGKRGKQDAEPNKENKGENQAHNEAQIKSTPTEKLPESKKKKKSNGQDAKPSKDKLTHNTSSNVSQPEKKSRPSKPKRTLRSSSSLKEKGKSFRSSLIKKEYSLNKQHGNVINLDSDDTDVRTTDNKGQYDIQRSVLNDLCRRDNNFCTPRKYLAEAQLPLVDQSIRVYLVKRVKDELDETLKEPSTVDRVPPISLLTESMEALVKAKNAKGNEGFKFVVEYDSYGCFTQEGVRILGRYDTLRAIGREVREEERWLDRACERLSSKEKQLLKEALLHRWNLNGQFLVQYKGFTVTSQPVSCLSCVVNVI